MLVHIEHNSRDKSRVPSWSAVSSTPISKPPNPTRSPNAFVSRIKPSASRCRNERIRHLKAIFDSTPIVHWNIYIWLETTGVDPGLNFAGVRITTADALGYCDFCLVCSVGCVRAHRWCSSGPSWLNRSAKQWILVSFNRDSSRPGPERKGRI